MHTCRFDMTAFCWGLRSDSSDTSNETVPLPSSMLVRRRIPAVSHLLNHNHLALDVMHAMIGCAAAVIFILLESESNHKDENLLTEACLSSQQKFQLHFGQLKGAKPVYFMADNSAESQAQAPAICSASNKVQMADRHCSCTHWRQDDGEQI